MIVTKGDESVYLDQDFTIFADPTLAGRLAKIKTILDPKFLSTVADLQPELAQLGVPVYAHVALHRRRTKNPPPDSWVAISTSKRGYKMLPHLEIGLWDDRLYIWLVVLQEAQERQAVLSRVKATTVAQLPQDFKLANDHTDKRAAQPLTLGNYQVLRSEQGHHRHAEWLVGQEFVCGDDFFHGRAETQVQTIRRVVAALIPVYRELVGSSNDSKPLNG